MQQPLQRGATPQKDAMTKPTQPLVISTDVELEKLLADALSNPRDKNLWLLKEKVAPMDKQFEMMMDPAVGPTKASEWARSQLKKALEAKQKTQ